MNSFSVARVGSAGDRTEYGAELIGQVNERLRLSARAATVDTDGVSTTNRLSIQGDYRLNIDGTLSSELRYLENELVGAQIADDGVVAALQYSHRLSSVAEIYSSGQLSFAESGSFEDRNMFVTGGRYRVGDQTGLAAEFLALDRGSALKATVEHNVNDAQSVYAGYTYSTDRTTQPSGNSSQYRNALILGQRLALSNQTTVFNESQLNDSPEASGMNHLFGLNFAPKPGWSLGFTATHGDLEGLNGEIERDAVSASIGYTDDNTHWVSKIEYRRDNDVERFTQWVSSNFLSRKLSESWRLLWQLNYADSDNNLDDQQDTLLVENSVGFSYRPTRHDRWNLLGKYTYLYDLSTLAQSGTGTDQRSNIASLEALYELTKSWELGLKLGYRRGELRQDRGASDWYRSTARFSAARARYHFIKKWDALLEYRWLSVDETDSARSGWLVGIERHIGNNMKLGVGYNFTDFSDDLTNLDYEYTGWFINAVGKY